MDKRVDASKWHAGDVEDSFDDLLPAILAENGWEVGRFYGAANRDHALMCVHAHEALVEALEKIARQEPIRHFGDSPVYHGSVDIARAALNKAKVTP